MSDRKGGFVTGLLAGGLVAALVFGTTGYWMVKREAENARRGWELVTVIVAAQDIPEGAVLRYDMLAQRKVPEQFVTTSVVLPRDSVYVIGKPTLVPSQAGDLLWWSHVAVERPR